MWTNKDKSREMMRDYDRGMLRSAFVSLFWNIIQFRKKQGNFSLTALAKAIGVHKSQPSRWFSGERPNWEANTIADIASALEVEIEIFAHDRVTGVRFAPYGPIETASRVVAPENLATIPPIQRFGTSTPEPNSDVFPKVAVHYAVH